MKVHGPRKHSVFVCQQSIEIEIVERNEMKVYIQSSIIYIILYGVLNVTYNEITWTIYIA